MRTSVELEVQQTEGVNNNGLGRRSPWWNRRKERKWLQATLSTRWPRAHPNQHLHERAGCGQYQHQQLCQQEVLLSVQLLLEGFWQLKQTCRLRQSWSGGSQGNSCPELCWLLEGRCKSGKEGPGGDGQERWGCLASTFKIFKLGGRSSQEQSVSRFQI